MKTILINSSGRSLFSIIGGTIALLHPTFPFIVVCTLMVLADVYTAWSLSRRVKRKYPHANDGKFKSVYFGRIFMTLIKIYVLIILSFLMERYIFEGLQIKLVNITAGAVCFWQLWSMLENESSCSDEKWAKVLQNVLVDKTARHFDVDLSDLTKGVSSKQ
jgi:hypothetical protein